MVITQLDVLFVQLLGTRQGLYVVLCCAKEKHIATMIKCLRHHSNQSCHCAVMSNRGQVMLG